MLEKFEEKISGCIERASKRVVGLAVFTMFGIILMFAMSMTKAYRNEKQNSSDIYNRTMYELIGHIQNVEVLVAKSRITSTKDISIVTYANIMSQANMAKDSLSKLPIDQNAMQNVSKFLAQVSSYAISLVEKLSSNRELEQKDYDDLKKINEYAKGLEETLNNIYQQLNDGKIKWNELEEVAQKDLENEESLVIKDLTSISESFTDYQGLIYDGAFSTHMEKTTAKSLSGNEVTLEEAKEKAKECLDLLWAKDSNMKKEIVEIKDTGEMSGNLDIYTFEVILKDTEETIDVQITKRDGKLLLLMYDREVKEKKITEKQAEEIGKKYLDNLGVDNMEATYYLQVDNMITVNYASVQNKVVMYPDLIKVKIAMDTGDVCSVECKGYIFNHIKRDNLNPSITMEQARRTINKDIEIMDSGVAIIPTDFNTEVLTYEFKGKIEEREFLIYVNAKTGKEQDVLYIINTPGGTLTM